MTQPNQWTPPPPPQYLPIAPNGQPLANFGDRFLAFLIDTAIYIGISLLFMVPLMFCWVFAMTEWSDDFSSRNEPSPGDVMAMFIPMILFMLVIFLLQFGFTYAYYVEWQLRKGGQTIGKGAMKIRVIPADPAAQLDRGMLVKRWAVQHVVGAFVPLFSYLDGFWQLWDKPLQQCLHDKAASSVVVKVG